VPPTRVWLLLGPLGTLGLGHLGTDPKPNATDALVATHLANVLLLREASVRCRIFGQPLATVEAELQDADELHVQAASALRAAVEFSPDDEALVLKAARFQRADGLKGDAIGSLLRALELRPRDPAVHAMLGAVYASQNRLPKAKQALRTALELDPSHVPALCHLGAVLRREGHLDDAVSTYEAALAAEAGSVDALVGLALTFETLGSLSSATQFYSEARRVTKGRDPDVLSNLGDVLAARGHVDDALACYEEAIALDPQGPSCVEAHLGRGLAHWRGGRYREAEASHRAALAVLPTHADAHHYLADTLRDGASQPVGASPGRGQGLGSAAGAGVGVSAGPGGPAGMGLPGSGKKNAAAAAARAQPRDRR